MKFLLTTCAATALLGCAATQTRAPAINDASLTRQVRSALVADPQTAGGGITVVTRRGVVQLSGFVDSSDQRREAARVAGSVGGVTTVRNDLQVGAHAGSIDDDVISSKVKAALARSSSTKAYQIEVRTDKGMVLLSGFVASSDQRDAATAVARSVRGVTAVNNSLRLDPAP